MEEKGGRVHARHNRAPSRDHDDDVERDRLAAQGWQCLQGASGLSWSELVDAHAKEKEQLQQAQKAAFSRIQKSLQHSKVQIQPTPLQQYGDAAGVDASSRRTPVLFVCTSPCALLSQLALFWTEQLHPTVIAATAATAHDEVKSFDPRVKAFLQAERSRLAQEAKSDPTSLLAALAQQQQQQQSRRGPPARRAAAAVAEEEEAEENGLEEGAEAGQRGAAEHAGAEREDASSGASTGPGAAAAAATEAEALPEYNPTLLRFSSLTQRSTPSSSSPSSSSSSSSFSSRAEFKFVVTLSEGMAQELFSLGRAVVVAQKFASDASPAAAAQQQQQQQQDEKALAALSAEVREFVEGLPDLFSMLQ